MHKLPTVRFRRKKGRPTGYFRIYANGTRREQPTPYATEKEAEPERKRLEAVLRAEHYQGPGYQRPGPELLTLSDLAETYCAEVHVEGRRAENTRNTQPGRVWSVVNAMGPDTPAHLVDNWAISKWLTYRLMSKCLVRGEGGTMRCSERRVSPTTVRNELAAFRAAYRWAVRMEILADPDDLSRPARVVPWTVPSEDWPRARTHKRLRLPAEHVTKILDALEPAEDDADLAVLLVLLTGMRGEDLDRLKWSEISGGVIRIETNKTREPAAWPLPDALGAFLAGLGREGRVFDPMPGFRRLRARVARACGYGWGIKAMRHTFKSGLETGGVHPRFIKALMGHVVRDVTDGYGYPTEGELRDALARLPWMKQAVANFGVKESKRGQTGGGKGGGRAA